MNLAELARKAQKIIGDNSPAILTALGVSGSLSTAYLAAKAAYASRGVIEAESQKADIYGDELLTLKDEARIVWKLYIPATVSATVTVVCIIAAAKVGQRRTAAITAAYSVTEKMFDEYKEKVVEKLGEKKEKTLRDEINQDRVNRAAPASDIFVASGQVLCYETYTGRVFTSDMEALRKAQNDINAKLLSEDVATLSDFYHMVGLPDTSHSSSLGWNSDKQFALSYTAVLTEDNRPCIAFEYNYIKSTH